MGGFESSAASLASKRPDLAPMDRATHSKTMRRSLIAALMLFLTFSNARFSSCRMRSRVTP